MSCFNSELGVFEFFQFNLATFLLVFLDASLNAVSRSLECVVLEEQLLVGVLPFDAVLLFELFLVFVHEAHEVDSEVVTKVELTSSVVRNGSQIGEDAHHVRLLVVIGIIRVKVPHQPVSVFDVRTNIRKVLYIFGVAHKRVPRSTLNLSSVPSDFLEPVHEVRVQ